MAFSYTKIRSTVFGNRRVSYGTYNSAAVTGGDIDTGLAVVEAMFFGGSGAAVNADMPAVNETMPCAGNAVTIVTTSGATGFWMAVGR